MAKDYSETMLFTPINREREFREILKEVYQALEEKEYSPFNQMIGYILSGDPTYITSYKGARKLIRQIDRDELLEELLAYYLKGDREEEKAEN
ncbi:IreB family regulatory phosphoprotein [Kallipyga gabonensis]|uniref:IreB family regulatory phosphoprotein n=1 Tax=Kallipyga gabonensis TaxID=1686287 RepID=UPI0006B40DF4|nr:IreB family regulatory phosphoprotein [Kallipyga gabonensis]